MGKERVYMCFDLKSFYASVECVARGLDPFETCLVVADPSRGERSICLAVSPAMKALGVPGRCRVYQIPRNIPYIKAMPRMQKYIEEATKVYGVYLQYVSAEDIHVYSIDEVFMDVTDYLEARGLDALGFARTVMADVKKETGLTVTCGIGPNLYLAKIALDIISKHAADFIGVLTEESFREKLWDHKPITDFWRISRGTEERLARLGIRTMRDICQTKEELLYKLFGVDAQLLIDHAWGRETVTISHIKAYKPASHSLTTGQVLHKGYDIPGAKLLILEMAELLSLELVEQRLAASTVELSLHYSFSLNRRPAHGSIRLDIPSNSTRTLLRYTEKLYDSVAVLDEPVYRLNIGFGTLVPEEGLQYELFSEPETQEKERRLQDAVIEIKRKYGKNGIFKAMNLLDGAKTLERNQQIGGHRA